MKKTILLWLALASAALAQEQIPHLGYVYPAGGQPGTTFFVTIGGQNLTGANAVRLSGSGIEATVIDVLRPLNQGAFKTVQKQMQDLVAKKKEAPSTWTTADDTTLVELQKQMNTFYIRQSSAPALVETVTLVVTLSDDAEPGPHELRLLTDLGLTNPLVFEVGPYPEVFESSARSLATADSQNGQRRRRPTEGSIKPVPGTQPVAENPGNTTPITLPATLNGQILPGDADRYRFQAQQGQPLLIDVHARRIIPYLSDAVPGWFQATVTLYDADGTEIAYADDFQFQPDPILRCDIPQDGTYTLEIRDALHRGREDFVYRIAIGEPPPDEHNKPEKNSTASAAQDVSIPQTIDGSINAPGDMHVFRFSGQAGQNIVAEIIARRLGSPLDSALKLTDVDGAQIAFNDDHETYDAGLATHHADSRLSATLPADGQYSLYLVDQQQNGGPDFTYRLQLTEPKPDFALRIVPSAINIEAGTSVPVTIHALRQDGFDGPIRLTLKDAPDGCTLSGAELPAGENKIQVTLTAPANALATITPLTLIGKATIGNRLVTRPAVPADDLMQAFIYRHLVTAEELLVCVLNQSGRFSVPIPPPDKDSIQLRPGKTARLPINIPAQTSWGSIELELINPPPGISIHQFVPGTKDGFIEFQCDAQAAQPGLKGNLIINVYAYRDPETMQGRGQRKKPNRLLTTLPAISFEIDEK
jgi:hypothetical protein